MGRIISLAALAAGIWLLSVFTPWRPAALGPETPPVQFSAARADAVLARILGEQRPHPAGSAEAEAVRGRILQELSAMGIFARTQIGMSCYGDRRWDNIPCATVTNIIAEAVPGTGKAVVLMAHSDSVAAGPGAGDDGSGVAILLETIRALKARHLEGAHPITAIFTDGEENGLLGANLFLRDRARRDGIGAVINVEARGNRGPSYLFQTSKGNRPLIALYARGMQRYATSSLYGEIYKYLPNDTDLTPVLAAGIPGYNFAFIGNVAHYHTPLDRRENLDPSSLQQQGDNALALADSLAHADYQTLKGEDAVYLDVLERWLPRLPQHRVLPSAIIVFLMIAVAGYLASRGRRSLSQSLQAGLMPPLLLAGAVGIGFVLHSLAAWISGEADPSFAHPLALRLSLACGVFAVALLTAQRASAIACWLWFSALAIAAAVWAPGLSPYFLFPSLVAAPLLLLTVRGGWGLAVFIGALAALVIWLGLNAGGEAIMGLKMHPLFTLTAAFGLMALLPLLRPASQWRWASGASLTLAVVLAVVAGLEPAFSDRAPERLNLRYVEQAGKAWWLADPVARLPDSLRAAARFSDRPERRVQFGYAAPAGNAQFPAPSATIQRNGDAVTINLNAAGAGVALLVPKEAGLKAVSLGGVTVPASGGRVTVSCATPDCGSAQMVLQLSSTVPANLTLIAYRHGLPPQAADLLKARPTWAVPSQSGDATLLAATLQVPAR
jgi:hypothetical protein